MLSTYLAIQFLNNRKPVLPARFEFILWSMVILLVLIALACLVWFCPALHPRRLIRAARLRLPNFRFSFSPLAWLQDKRVKHALKATGFMYDPSQDIFYSVMDAWQKDYGYCRMYDEAAIPLGMVIDCEPVCFKYAGKNWLIEFWKGQYDLTTGAEIGVFVNDGKEPNAAYFYHGAYYYSAGDADRPEMSFTLLKNNQKLFERHDRHWWLTGFVLGMFSEPEQLLMKIRITLKDRAMCSAFTKGLREAGYTREEYEVDGKTVSFEFHMPHTPQPVTRNPALDWVIQRKNELLCESYADITSGYAKLPAKLRALKKKSPDLYAKATNIRRSRQLAGIYRKY